MSGASTVQGWIINRGCDAIFFIGTPLLSLVALLIASQYFSSADIAWFVLAFFAVGHHLPRLHARPTEKESFLTATRRPFLVSPLVVTAFVAWSVFNGHLGFFIFLALWDLWHFFMQHLRLHEDLRCQTPQALIPQFAAGLVADGRLVRLYHHRQPPIT